MGFTPHKGGSRHLGASLEQRGHGFESLLCHRLTVWPLASPYGCAYGVISHAALRVSPLAGNPRNKAVKMPKKPFLRAPGSGGDQAQCQGCPIGSSHCPIHAYKDASEQRWDGGVACRLLLLYTVKSCPKGSSSLSGQLETT